MIKNDLNEQKDLYKSGNLYEVDYMDNIMQMSTTVRHNKIIMAISGEIKELLRKKAVYALQEECALVHWGRKRKNELTSLINTADIEDLERFEDFTIYELDYVQPDFLLFKDNKYITDSRDLRTAGQPDLIIEVWSDGNTKTDRAFLQDLYATSDITEFWQMEQYSNTVKCSAGTMNLPDQSLKDILRTQKGLEFDLRYLAV
ncbi:MAG: Uma2 family endonuclease [Oscillospiraceae bacterium]|nr:Uma2 family endonuclease [Oscillospiraceae bacterium]